MDIIIDTTGQEDLKTRDRLIDSDDDDFDFGLIDLDPTCLKKKEKDVTKTKVDDFDIDTFEAEMGWKNKRKKMQKKATTLAKFDKELNPVEKALEKSVIKPGFEQPGTVPRYDDSKRRLRSIRLREQKKTKGSQWFNMPAPEMTPEIRHDLQVIQMRSVLDPKHFYKKNDLKVLPKYFQIGKVIDSPLDYYNGRLTKKERKKTIVDELMADAQFAKYNKRKYKEIIDEKRKKHYKSLKHAKRLKSKKKK